MFDSGISVKQLIDELKNEVDVAPEITDDSYVEWLNSLQQLLYGEIIKEQAKFEKSVTSDIIPIDSIIVPDKANKVRFEDIHAIYADGTQLIKSTVASGGIFNNTFYKLNNDVAINVPSIKKTVIKYVGDDVPVGNPVVLSKLNIYGKEYTTAEDPEGNAHSQGILTLDNGSYGTIYVNEIIPTELQKTSIHTIFAYYDGPVVTDKRDDVYATFEILSKEIVIIFIVKPELVTTANMSNSNVMVPIEFIDLVKAKLRGEAYKLMNEDSYAAKWLNDYNILVESFKVWIEDKKPKFGL